MSEELQRLLEKARRVVVSSSEAERQRRSFAYGNTHFENERITKELVDKEADELSRGSERD